MDVLGIGHERVSHRVLAIPGPPFQSILAQCAIHSSVWALWGSQRDNQHRNLQVVDSKWLLHAGLADVYPPCKFEGIPTHHAEGVVETLATDGVW